MKSQNPKTINARPAQQTRVPQLGALSPSVTPEGPTEYAKEETICEAAGRVLNRLNAVNARLLGLRYLLTGTAEPQPDSPSPVALEAVIGDSNFTLNSIEQTLSYIEFKVGMNN
jgi:hypothetical protein